MISQEFLIKYARAKARMAVLDARLYELDKLSAVSLAKAHAALERLKLSN